MHVLFDARGMPKSKASSKKGSARKSGGVSRTVTATIPKSLQSTMDKIRAKVDQVDAQLREHVRNFNTQAKAWSKQMSERSSGGKQRAKRKPSEYNLFLKDKMKQGMTMTEAVQAWKQRGGSSSETASSMSSSRMTSSSMDEEEGESETEDEA